MIKFLHTADLHLGKVFHDQSLGEDQAFVMEGLVRLLEKAIESGEPYAALVIAGDVYDRSIPSPEAVDLFGSFLAKVKRLNPSPEVIIIPGNHDSASRLGFGRELFSRLGIRFGVSAGDCDKPVIVERGGERCAFFLLPFLNPGVLEKQEPETGERVPLRSQSALAEEAARRMEKTRKELAAQGISRSVLAAHLFASGGEEACSERVFLGSAELVNVALFKGFDYIALGHLHRCQRAGENAWYPGSPLVYSFGEAASGQSPGQSFELGLGQSSGQNFRQSPGQSPKQSPKSSAEKFFLSVQLGEGGAAVEKIPVKPLRKVTSLSGPFARFAGAMQADPELLAAADDYLEIRLTDRGITENARDILRKRFPRLLSLRQDEALAGLSSAIAAAAPASGERRDSSADFRDFLLGLYGKADAADISADSSSDISEELSAELELFNTLLADIDAEEASS